MNEIEHFAGCAWNEGDAETRAKIEKRVPVIVTSSNDKTVTYMCRKCMATVTTPKEQPVS